MNYNYDRKKSYKSWIIKKEKEENELRNKGVNETYIMLLREMDKRMFNEERKHHRHQEIVKDEFWTSLPDKSPKSVINIEEILDEIENEILYEIIKNLDDESKMIIELKFQGYFVWEIANITKLSIDQINYKIKKIRKMFKNFKNSNFT